MSNDPDENLVSDATQAEEEKEAAEKHEPDRDPTPEEEAAADRMRHLEPGVAEAHEEANERGANVKGEGQV